MSKSHIIFISFLIALNGAFSIASYAQSSRGEAKLMFLQANVLFEEGRFDESVRMYNQIIASEDVVYQAYVMRAKAKYELGAFKGTKKDILAYIAERGVNKEVIKIMAKTELKLKNYDAAQQYVLTSIELDPYDSEQYRAAGDVAHSLKKKNDACEYWSKAAKLADSKASKLLQRYCDIDGIEVASQSETRAIEPEEETIETDSPSREREPIDLSSLELPERSTDIIKTPKKEEPKRESIDEPDRDASQEITIDEDLTIVIGNGLGDRKLDYNPDIFILSNEEGRVAIDVCVDGTGKVLSAELDSERSTIKKSGLISLAIRKSKEFEFYPSFREEQCGFFIFLIKRN